MPAPVLQVTFLFTDIEGSTRLWEQDAARMSQALALHDALARSSVESHGGSVVKTTGDGIHAVVRRRECSARRHIGLATSAPRFRRWRRRAASRALRAASRRRRAPRRRLLRQHRQSRGADHGRGARRPDTCCRRPWSTSVRDCLPAQVSLRDLGSVRLRDLSTPECVYQVVHPQLRDGVSRRCARWRRRRTTFRCSRRRSSAATSELAELKRLLRHGAPAHAHRCRRLRQDPPGACSLPPIRSTRFPDGAWLVELAPLSDPGLVPRTAATVLGARGRAGQADDEHARRASQGQARSCCCSTTASTCSARAPRSPSRSCGRCPQADDPGKQPGGARHRR